MRADEGRFSRNLPEIKMKARTVAEREEESCGAIAHLSCV